MFVDHDRNDPGVILRDPVVWRRRARVGGAPEQRNISADVREVIVTSGQIIITGKDGSRATASHGPESSPGMRTGVVESVATA